MKSNDIAFFGVAVALTAAGAWWILRRRAAMAASAPPAIEQYHPVTNPNGYSYFPSASGGGTWSKVTADGKPVYWADVL